MKTLIYDRNKIKDYKQFYELIYSDLDGKNLVDWENSENLNFNANNLSEFLWYCLDQGNTFVFKNFNLDAIEDSYNRKNYEDYNWKIIFEVFKEFVEKYPQNKLEFKNDK